MENWQLKQLQGLPLEVKIEKTKQRIKEWYEYWEGQVYISFSGGKDSTVLLHIVRELYPTVPAVFVDTGLEYPEIREFVRTFDNIAWVKPEMNFKQVIQKYGYPVISKEVAQKIYNYRRNPNGWTKARFDENSDYVKKYGKSYCLSKWIWLRDSSIPISHQCCNIMKKKPANKYERETGNKPIVATMTCESRNRRTSWLTNGCNAFNSKRPISQPLSFWTEQDILQYIKEFNIPYASVYGEILQDEKGKYYTTGCDRTGCMFCMFGVHLEKEPNRFQRMKITHPKIYEYCINKLELGKVLDYIGINYE